MKMIANICSWAVLISMATILFIALWLYPAKCLTPFTAKILAIWIACAMAWVSVLEDIEKRGENETRD